MRLLSLKSLFQEMIEALEVEVAPNLPRGYSRAQALAVAAILDQLIERVELKRDAVELDNVSMRRTLTAIAAMMGTSAEQVAMRQTIDSCAGPSGNAPADESVKLKQALVKVITGLEALALPQEEEAAVERLIRDQLREQLDREQSMVRPIKHWGELFTEG